MTIPDDSPRFTEADVDRAIRSFLVDTIADLALLVFPNIDSKGETFGYELAGPWTEFVLAGGSVAELAGEPRMHPVDALADRSRTDRVRAWASAQTDTDALLAAVRAGTAAVRRRYDDELGP